MRTLQRWIAIAAIGFAAAGAAPAAESGAYPTHAIKIVIPYAEGGPTSAVANALLPAMSAALGQPIDVSYRGGAGATKGTAEVLESGGDGGYTLLLHNIGFASAQTLYRHLPYNAQRDFMPIGRIADAPMVILSRNGFPVTDPRKLLPYIKQNQQTLTIAYGGPGGAGQLCGLILERDLKAKLFWVPFKGTGPALADLVAGRSDLLCDQTTHTLKVVDQGKANALLLAAPERLPLRPELMTSGELGMPSLQVAVWHGLFAVKGTPPEVIAKLSAALQTAVTTPSFIAAMRNVGVVPATAEQATPKAMAALLASEVQRWKFLIEGTGQYAD